MSAVRVRRAYGSDLAALQALCAEHAAYERLTHAPGARLPALAEALDAAPPRLYAWLAEDRTEVLGYASATLDFSTLERASFLHLDCLYVREAWRGQGVGLRLWQAAHALAADLGCPAMQWQTPDWNEPAIRFYRRLGAMAKPKLRFTLALADGIAAPPP